MKSKSIKMNNQQVAEENGQQDIFEADSDGYISGEDQPTPPESVFSSFDEDGPVQMFATDYVEDWPWAEEDADIIVSSEGPHYCIHCTPWENDLARDYLRRLYQERNKVAEKKRLTDSEIAEIHAVLPSTPTHLRHLKFAKLRVLRMRQFELRIVFKKLVKRIHEEARLYLFRMNGKESGLDG